MKAPLTLLIFLISIATAAQLNRKTVEKADGVYTYCYHSNGKISTEEFHPVADTYMAEGYSKAFDKNGVLIYEAKSSRSGQLSGTYFSYYDNGAVKSAEYSSHPDAGIQWYRKMVYFDEHGSKTGEWEQSHDDTVTIMEIPNQEQELYVPVVQERNEQHRQDSIAFYTPFRDTLDNGWIVTRFLFPDEGKRETVTWKGNKAVRIETEFMDQSAGVHTIIRTYYKNGLIHEEWIHERDFFHYREYDKKGFLILEKLNQKQ